MSKDYPWGKGTVVTERLNSTADSDVTITIPVGKRRRYTHFQAQITCSADVGNRNLAILFAPGGVGAMWSMKTGNITASQVGMVTLGRDIPYSTTPRTGVITSQNTTANVAIYDSLPDVILGNGDTIRVWDVAAIAAAADNMYLFYSYVEWDA